MSANITKIVTAIENYLEQFTTNKSIGRPQLTEAIALAVQATYSVPDVFMANQNVDEVDFSNYLNVERLFAKSNPFKSMDISAMTLLKRFEISIGFGEKFFNTIDFSNNVLLEHIDAEFSGLQTLDLTMLPNLTYLNLNGNVLTDLDISGNPDIIYLDLGNNPTLPSTAINAILSNLVAFGQLNGTFNFFGTGGATGQGITDIATLDSRGWTI